MSTWCCEETETPRVRTIFPGPPEPPPLAALPEAENSASPQDWPGLLAAVLQALLPFHDALEAARQVIRDARSKLPSPE